MTKPMDSYEPLRQNVIATSEQTVSLIQYFEQPGAPANYLETAAALRQLYAQIKSAYDEIKVLRENRGSGVDVKIQELKNLNDRVMNYQNQLLAALAENINKQAITQSNDLPGMIEALGKTPQHNPHAQKLYQKGTEVEKSYDDLKEKQKAYQQQPTTENWQALFDSLKKLNQLNYEMGILKEVGRKLEVAAFAPIPATMPPPVQSKPPSNPPPVPPTKAAPTTAPVPPPVPKGVKPADMSVSDAFFEKNRQELYPPPPPDPKRKRIKPPPPTTPYPGDAVLKEAKPERDKRAANPFKGLWSKVKEVGKSKASKEPTPPKPPSHKSNKFK